VPKSIYAAKGWQRIPALGKVCCPQPQGACFTSQVHASATDALRPLQASLVETKHAVKMIYKGSGRRGSSGTTIVA